MIINNVTTNDMFWNVNELAEEETLECIMPVREFIQACKMTCFTDYDGYGYAIIGNEIKEQPIFPSRLNEIPQDATHIKWFNK